MVGFIYFKEDAPVPVAKIRKPVRLRPVVIEYGQEVEAHHIFALAQIDVIDAQGYLASPGCKASPKFLNQ